ncbi:similar to Saccharomyces cerevisiae YBL088C TEL1 Protein kinase primarily involved in telomere length regulation [Maudiozyma saulgeensis]|uniref:Serine/threonine-protein kinase Tel1 n=1 Tax=Maudiozyma saulgeensis TaxID=1789683 RepID=A0A1X7R775_9SACH|nr:similar to Saccharomyces cerevisiae YBL088C TEL1 Protein kinase primarily involved in telomere length regulation [Kazachstania saulgeensis]
MNNTDIITILSSFSSSKLKERNAALEDLTTVLKEDPSRIPSKALHGTSESLIELLDLEHRKYYDLLDDRSKSNTSKLSLSENRLSTVAYVLRLFIEKVGYRFKLKTLNLHLAILPELMVKDRDQTLVEPASVHLTFALLNIIESCPFQLKFTSHQWFSLMEKVCLCLNKQISISVSNRTVSNLISIVASLLKLDTIALYDGALSVHGTILRLLKTVEYLSTDTRTIIQIVNLLLAKTFMSHINVCFSIIQETWKYAINFNDSTVEPLQDELMYHYLLSTDLICHKLPNMVGVSLPTFDDNSFLDLFKQTLSTRLNTYNPKSLDPQSIIFNKTININDLDWLNFCDIKLNTEENPKSWINTLVSVKLLQAYFYLKQNLSNSIPLFKRNKTENEFNTALNNCVNIESLLLECLSSTSSTKVQLTSLQLFTFLASMSNIRESSLNEFKSTLLQRFENPDLITWCTISLVPLLTQSSLQLREEDIVKITKLCLPLIKEHNNCRPACSVISKIIRYSDKIVADPTLRNQIFDLYDLSDVNGPSLVCNESFEFWQYLQHYASEYRSREGKLSEYRVRIWLMNSWDQIFSSSENQKEIDLFLLWLAGIDIDDRPNIIETMAIENAEQYLSWGHRIIIEKESRPHRKFLIQPPQTEKQIKYGQRTIQMIRNISNNKTVNDILFKALDILEKHDTYSIDVILKWTFTLLRIGKYIKSNTDYEDFIYALKNTLYLSKYSVEFKSYKTYLQYFKEVIRGDFDWALVDEIFDHSHIFNLFTDKFLVINTNKDNNDRDFEKTSPEKTIKRTGTPLPQEYAIIYDSFELRLSFEALTHIILDSNSENRFSILLDYLNKLTPQLIISCLRLFFKLSQNNKKSTLDIGNSELEKLTSLVGQKLLSNQYNTSNATIECLCDYLFIVDEHWLSDPSSHIYSDCNDILNWLIMRFEDQTFSGTYALRHLILLFLNILTYPKLSQNTDKGTKQRIFEVLIQCLQRLDTNSIMCVENSIIEYMKIITYKNQNIFLKEIIKVFSVPQQSIEIAACYTLTLIHMTSISYTILVQCLLDMLSYQQYYHVEYFIHHAFDLITKSWKMETALELFDMCKLELLSNWIKGISKSDSTSIYQWDITAFGFSDIDHVYIKYSREIGAIYMSSGSNCKDVLDRLLKNGSKDEADILTRSLFLAIPLAFVEDNIGSLIFDVGFQLLGKNMQVYEKKDSLLTFKIFLRLLDLGRPDDVNSALQRYYPNIIKWNEIIKNEKSTIRYQFPFHIDLISGMKFMNAYFNHSEFVRSEICERLLWVELTELENSDEVIGKLRCLREIKVIFFHFGKNLFKCVGYHAIIRKIAQYIMDKNLLFDIIPLLQIIFTNEQRTIIDSKKSISTVFLQFIRLKLHINLNFGSEITSLLNEISISTDQNGFPLWSMCIEYINGNEIELDYNIVSEVLNGLLYCDEDLLIISVLLSDNTKVHLNKSQFELSERSLFRLLTTDVDSPFSSKRFTLLKALFIKYKVDKNISIPSSAEAASIIPKCSNIFKSSNPLLIFYQDFLNFNKHLDSKNDSNKTFLLSRTISDFLLCNIGSGSIIDTTRINLREFPDKLNNTQELIYDIISPHWEPHVDINEFALDSKKYEKFSSDLWRTSFMSALLQAMSFTVPIITIFNPLIVESYQYRQKTFNSLFILSLFYDPKGFIEWYPTLIITVMNSSNVTDYEAKLRIVLSTVSIIRYGCKLQNKCCMKAFQKLNLSQLCFLAIDAKMPTLGLMLYEEIYMEKNTENDQILLSKVYDSLGDRDFQSGLPPAHSLMEAFNSTIKLDYNPWKSFVFSNASFDANYKSRTSDDLTLLKMTSEKNGFYGITKSIESGNPSQESNENFDWNFQLGNWDLPIPEKVDSISKGLYSTLKLVNNEHSSVNLALEESLIRIMGAQNNFKNSEDWFGLVTEIGKLIDIVDNLNIPMKLGDVLNKIAKYSNSTPNPADLDNQRMFLQSRHHFLSAIFANVKLSAHYNPITLDLARTIVLKDQMKFSIKNHKLQDSLRNAFILTSLNKVSQSPPIEDSISHASSRLISFLSAITLWESDDYKTPIMMMNDLLRTSEPEIEADISEFKPLVNLLSVENGIVLGYLVKWCSESRMESPNEIYKKYIGGKTIQVEESDLRARTFRIFGDFLNNQIKKLQASGEIGKFQERSKISRQNLETLTLISQNQTVSEKERKVAKRHIYKAQLQYDRDQGRLNELELLRDEFTYESLNFYMKTLISTNIYDSDVMDKFCALWFENADNSTLNQKLMESISSIPSWKFIPWVNQISSKLNNDDSAFQKPLQLTMKRLLYKLPYESIYSAISIKLYQIYTIGSNANIVGKIAAVKNIFESLQSFDSGNYYSKYILPIEEFCQKSVELASFRIKEASKVINLKGLKIGDYWLNKLPMNKIPLPTDHITIHSSEDGKKNRPYIVSVTEDIHVTSTGISLPKIVKFKMSNGVTKQVLMKGSNDDLRQDAIMEQVFTQVNNILMQNEELSKSKLRIRTYKVIPLGPRAGIIEFVNNSVSLHQVLKEYHKDDKLKFDDARREMKAVQTKPNPERLKIYNKIVSIIEPQLRMFFFENFIDYNAWFEAKKCYTRGMATTSIVGYILGLGDRHLNNILLDSSTGEPIHIDLGIAFDQGKLLPIPELVPFRLTRDIIDGFGITGVDGLFKRSCERVYTALRKDSEKVMCVLNVLKWDPLYSWVISPVTKHKHLLEDDTELDDNPNLEQRTNNKDGKQVVDNNDNQESNRALKGVEEKLNGDGLRVEATIEGLIQDATNPENLSIIYMGWSPFY